MSVNEQIQDVIAQLPPKQQEQVLDFVRALRRKLEDEDKALGEAGAKLAAKILESEDFSDWEKPPRE